MNPGLAALPDVPTTTQNKPMEVRGPLTDAGTENLRQALEAVIRITVDLGDVRYRPILGSAGLHGVSVPGWGYEMVWI